MDYKLRKLIGRLCREYEQKYKRPWTNDTQYIDNVLGHVYKKWIPLLHERLKGEYDYNKK